MPRTPPAGKLYSAVARPLTSAMSGEYRFCTPYFLRADKFLSFLKTVFMDLFNLPGFRSNFSLTNMTSSWHLFSRSRPDSLKPPAASFSANVVKVSELNSAASIIFLLVLTNIFS